MENNAFDNENEDATENTNDGDDDVIIESENSDPREINLMPYSRVLYVITWPVLKVHDSIQTRLEKIKIVAHYVSLIAWLLYLIVALFLNFRKTVGVAALTLVVLLYTKCGKFFNEIFKKIKRKIMTYPNVQLYAKVTVGVIALITLAGLACYQVVKNPSCLQSLIGLFTIPFVALFFTSDASRIQTRPIVFGLVMQVVYGIACFRFPVGRNAIKAIAEFIQQGVNYTQVGSEFVFGPSYKDHLIAFYVMPIIIYVSAIISLLFHTGVIPAVIKVLAAFVSIFSGITAPEALACIGSMFFGQIETLLLIAPCLDELTKSELVLALGAGFGTTSGSALFAYISLGVSATDLFTATFMAVPAIIVISKIIQPQIYYSKFAESSIDKSLKHEKYDSAMLAFMEGAKTGGMIVIQVMLVLIVFYSFLSLLDGIFVFIMSLVNVDLKFEELLGYAFYPVAFMIGVPSNECVKVSNLIATKIFFNEYVAYQKMLELDTELSARSRQLSTFALCGFANLGSVAIIGTSGEILSKSLSPKRIDSSIWKGFLVGVLASLFNATVVGLIHPIEIDTEMYNSTSVDFPGLKLPHEISRN